MNTRKEKSRKRAISNKIPQSSDDNTDNITSEENEREENQTPTDPQPSTSKAQPEGDTASLKSGKLPLKKATRKPKMPEPEDKTFTDPQPSTSKAQPEEDTSSLKSGKLSLKIKATRKPKQFKPEDKTLTDPQPSTSKETASFKSWDLPPKKMKTTHKPKQPKPGHKKAKESPEKDDDEDSRDEFVAVQSRTETKPTIPSRSILQFKIVLRDIKPPIWRRIQVLNTNTFYNLHCHIHEAMGWTSTHAHHFVVHDAKKNKSVCIDNGIIEGLTREGRGYLKEQTTKLSKFMSAKGDRMLYEYDFGDSWIHDIIVEKVLPPPGPKAEFPKCTGGKRACPPEDCGGVDGYQHLLEVYKDKNHPEYAELISDWLEEFNPGWDPEKFDKKQIFRRVRTWVLG